MWAAMTFFLSLITNLEELVIKSTPLCEHQLDRYCTTNLRNPPFPYLPKLRSLAITTKCDICSRHMAKLFILASPSLQHLKFTCNYGIDHKYAKIFQEWSIIYGKPQFPLETLAIKILGNRGSERTLQSITRLFPDLKDLKFQAHYDMISKGLEPAFVILAHPPTASVESWAFHISEAGPNESTPPEPMDDSFEGLLDIISNMKYLIEIELTILVDVDLNPPKVSESYTTITRSDFDRQEVSIDKHYVILTNCMTSIADSFFKKIPSLRMFYLWSPTSELPMTVSKWKRVSLPRGKYDQAEKKVDFYYDYFDKGWLINTDGEAAFATFDDDSDSEDEE